MDTFVSYYLNLYYEANVTEQDKLPKIDRLVDWEKFRPIIAQLYRNKTSKGGRPNMDEIMMLKCLVLKSYYNLSDTQLEFQLKDSLSFQNFIAAGEATGVAAALHPGCVALTIGLNQSVPDFTIVWLFRERLVKSKVEALVWDELQRQLKLHGIVAKRGMIQDATFIESPVGRKRKGEGGNRDSESNRSSSQLDTDASFSVKRNQIHHGYKLHTKVDVDYGFIRRYAAITAKTHDSRIELSEPEDGKMYCDKGYSGVPLRHPGVEDCTLHKAARNRPLTDEEKARNRCLSRIRSPGERPFAVLKNIFGRGHTRLKRLGRVRVQQFFNCFIFNVVHRYHCHRRGRLPVGGRGGRGFSDAGGG